MLSETAGSVDLLNGDPLPWLLEDDNPAVRHLTLRLLLDWLPEDAEVRHAQAAAMGVDPIAAILAAQRSEGYWEKPGPGYSPKYRGTVWQVIFLDQLGADGSDERVRAACQYVLSRTQTEAGGFGASGDVRDIVPASSRSIHCLNGNLLRTLLGFGWLEDERVQRAIEWQARSITGEGFAHYYQSGASGPGFCCAANEKLPCAWGAVKAMLALARIPPERRALYVQLAIRQGVDFLLSVDPAAASYPMGWGNRKPSGSWFKLGFPSGYVADVLQNLEALCELGLAKDPRLHPAVEWLRSKQGKQGRWKNEYAYNGKTWVDFEKQGQPSKWVTLRACRVLKAVSL
ncbi:MAG: nitrogen fixation protein NifH [Chloroflexi bacterium]|nr:nitrogen fixation protein NifH [Chloroflexota bacterium]